ncbi:MAG: pilus assembly protein PilM [Planctomycetota bacterium]|nr:pilus assembly protein PilM [Planctomycetota bacterium]
MARQATGIDIGRSTVKAIKGYLKGSTFHVTDFRLHEEGAQDVGSRWGDLEDDFKLTHARVGLSGKDVNIRYVRVPRVPDWQLRKLMRFEVAEIGETSGEGVASDFNLLPDLPEAGGEDIVLLAMARESLLEEHLEGGAHLKGRVDSFAPTAVAIYNAWLRYGVVQDDTVLIADIGSDNMDVAIVRGPDLLFARNLSGGGDLFDQAIASQLGVSKEQAQKLKIEHANLSPGARASSPNAERVNRAIQGAAGQVMSLLQSAILFCKTQIRIGGLKVDRIQLCGGAAGMDGLCEYLSRSMGVPVERFDPFGVVDASALSEDQARNLEDYRLEAVAALGLATMSATDDSFSLEILPAALHSRREFWGGKIFLIAAAVMAVAYLAWFTTDVKRQVESTEKQVRVLKSQLRKARSADVRTRQYLEENERLAKTAHELYWSAGMGVQAQQSLGFFAKGLPDDFWLTQVEVERGTDDELGIARETGERPVLKSKGRARESAVSPAAQHREMIANLQTGFPGANVNHTVDRSSFSVDITFFADKPESGEADTESQE